MYSQSYGVYILVHTPRARSIDLSMFLTAGLRIAQRQTSWSGRCMKREKLHPGKHRLVTYVVGLRVHLDFLFNSSRNPSLAL